MFQIARRVIFVSLTLILAGMLAAPADAATKKKKTAIHPGKARWAIKTSVPDGIGLFATQDVDLSQLLAIKPPPGARGHSRKMDAKRYPAAGNAGGLTEGEIISTRGWIHLIAAEPDGDYHIQIAQTHTSEVRCFIVEVPRPLKSFVKNDRVRDAAGAVRSKINSRLLGGKELKSGHRLIDPPVFAKITGQFFYDDWHIGDNPRGKKGCKSPTIAEVHPITEIVFAPNP
jgi:hypothetical protein